MLSLAVNTANKAIDLRYLAIITSFWLKSSKSTACTLARLNIVSVPDIAVKEDLRLVTVYNL